MWVAVGITAASVVTSISAGEKGKKAAKKEAELQRQAGAMKKEASYFEANVLETQAVQRVAVAHLQALDIQRVTSLTNSRAQALAAFSGGGASAPTVVKVMADIAKEGARNAAYALYSGEEAARTMRLQAFQKRKEGDFAEISGGQLASASEARGSAAELQGFGNALGAVGGLYGKYGGKA